jgi:hypothetical protein
MISYQTLPLYQAQNLFFQVTPASPVSGFHLAGGVQHESGFVTGFVFSGDKGYIFDESGLFFGGFQSGVPLDIKVSLFEENRYSYFFNNVLVANNKSCGTITDIEFENGGSSLLSMKLEGRAGENFTYLIDSSGIILFDSDNLLLTSIP